MRKVSPFDLKRNINRGHRFGQRFMSKPPRSPWDFFELYGRTTRWAAAFRHRLASDRIEASQRRFRNELLDCISLSSTPIMDSLMGKR